MPPFHRSHPWSPYPGLSVFFLSQNLLQFELMYVFVNLTVASFPYSTGSSIREDTTSFSFIIFQEASLMFYRYQIIYRKNEWILRFFPYAVVLNWDDLPSPSLALGGTFGKVHKHFWISQLEWNCYWHLVSTGQDSPKHPTMQRIQQSITQPKMSIVLWLRSPALSLVM